MIGRPDPEDLVLEDLTDEQRRALLERIDAGEAEQLDALASAFSALEADAWRDAEVPRLRFVPDGVGQPSSFWQRGCVRDDGYGPRIPAPLAFGGIGAMVVVALIVGLVLGGTSGDSGSAPQADARLERAAPVSLLRTGSSPEDASGVVRMVAGADGRMTLRAHGLKPTGDQRWYEVWMLRDAKHMVSVGTFRVRQDGTVDATFRLKADPSRFPTMDVSLQTAADGKAHSGRSVLRSRAS